MGIWSVNRTVGCFDKRIEFSYSVNVYKLAVISLISLESLSSAWVKNLEIADVESILLLPRCDCKSAEPIQN